MHEQRKISFTGWIVGEVAIGLAGMKFSGSPSNLGIIKAKQNKLDNKKKQNSTIFLKVK